MSVEAMTWALAQSAPTPTAKLVLIGLANHADKHGRHAWPSNETLAEYANDCDVRTVRRAKRALEDVGLISLSPDWQPIHISADRRPYSYDLPIARGDNLSSRDAAPVADGGTVLSSRDVDGGTAVSGRGGTSETARGDTGVPRTVSEPSVEPKASSAHADAANDSKQKGDGSKHEEDADPDAAEFEERIWQPYPPMPNGTKPSKGKALAAWRALPKAARTRAAVGVTHLAAAVRRGETIPKHAFRFLRRDSAGDFPFDDWQRPAGQPGADANRQRVGRDLAIALGRGRARHGIDEDTVRAELESKYADHVQAGLAAYRQQRQEPAA